MNTALGSAVLTAGLFVSSMCSSVGRAQPPADAPVPDEATAGEAAAAEELDDPAAAAVPRIRAALEAIGGYDDVTVGSRAGVVLLRGGVSTPAARQAAQKVAEHAATEALFVANGIQITAIEEDEGVDESLAADDQDSATAGNIRRIFREVPELSEVEVSVQGGIVHLRGVTKDEDALERAVEIVREQSNVIYVDDSVEVRTSIGEQVQATIVDLKRKGRSLIGKLPVAGIALLVLFLAGLLAKLISGSKVGSRLFTDSPLLRQVVGRLMATVVIIAGIILALDIMGATGAVGAVMGTAGIVGLAVGFAFKDIVENYLAGVLLAFHRPFAAGDLIELNGNHGKVIRLASRETILMTLEGNHVQIPNSEVFKASMINYTRNPKRRLDFTVGIGTSEELSRAQKIGTAALVDIEGVMDTPAPFARVDEFADSSMTVHFYAWVDQSEFDYLKVKSEAVRRVKRALDKAGIDLPNPIYEVDVYTEKGKRAKHITPSTEPEQSPHDLTVDNEIDKQIAEDPEAHKADLLDRARD